MILTVTVNPLIDKTYLVDGFDRGKILRVNDIKLLPGGKGVNVARVLKMLSAPVEAFVVTGGETGQIYQQLLREDGLEAISHERQHPTRYSTAIFEPEKNSTTTFIEEAPKLTPDETSAIKESILEILPKYSFLVLSGSFPGDYEDFYFEIISEANRNGLVTVLDSYGKAFKRGVEAAPFFIKPNRQEFEAAFGKSLKSDDDYVSAFRFLGMKGIELVVITDGARGFRACWKNHIYKVTPPEIEEVNPIGSGDTLVACIVYGLKEKMDFEDTLRLAASAGCANASEYEAGYFAYSSTERYLHRIKIEKTSL